VLLLVAAALAAPQYQRTKPNQGAGSISPEQWASLNPIKPGSGNDELSKQWARFLE
jgi:hypothetical protein